MYPCGFLERIEWLVSTPVSSAIGQSCEILEGRGNWIQIQFRTAKISSEVLDRFFGAERTLAELGLISPPGTF